MPPNRLCISVRTFSTPSRGGCAAACDGGARCPRCAAGPAPPSHAYLALETVDALDLRNLYTALAKKL